MTEFDILEIETVESDDEKDEPRKRRKKKTPSIMTRYEYTKLIACRAIQIKGGADVVLKEAEGVYDPIEIAKMELHARKIPLVIKRHLPNGKEEVWKIQDMHIRDY